MDLRNVSEAAIEKAKEIMKAGPISVQKDLTSASGFDGYNLQPVAILLQPVITPWRNNIPRVTNTRGGVASHWRVISQLVSKNTDPFVSADFLTWAAEDAARGFEGDIRARAVTNLLFALMIQEELVIGFGRVSDLGTVTAPTVVTSATGGTIAAGTYKVTVRAITGMGDGTNPRGKKSSQTTTSALSGSTNSMTASTPWVEGAVQYEWYVDDGASGSSTLQTTTGINSVALTALTTSGTVLPADNVANSLAINGLIPQLTAALGAQIKTLAKGVDGVGTDFTLDDIDSMNKAVWDNAKADPETIWMNSTQVVRATNLVLAANGAPSLFVSNVADMKELTGGYLLANWINKATGRVQRVRVHPALPDGTMLAYSNQIPFPTGGDMVGVDIEVSRDYQQVDYALTARRYDFEVFCREVLRMKFPGGAWIIRNIRSNQTT